jgi:serine protease AprX
MLKYGNFLFLLILVLGIQGLFAQSPSSGQEVTKVWVFFKDKGIHNDHLLQKPTALLSEHALQRRLKVMPADALIDERDLPVNADYVQALSAHVSKIRVQSRWLNAVSVETESAGIQRIQALPFVEKVQPVQSYRRERPIEGPVIRHRPVSLPKTGIDLDYGVSATQLNQINVPALHQMGYYGQGVIIAMLDDGFNLLNYHITFDSLNVLDTWDFINDDASVDDSGLEATEGWHGTKTLSTIAGYTPGQLIGPAFKASFLLAKTEVNSSETPIEEDYWVAGLEWAEGKGADIASSSLGYIDWYTWEDMDGETAVTTIAADLAVERGVIVVNSAGNEGYNELQNTLIAPADGKKVIAVGAVTSSSIRSSFSSVGPSVDGRIKPDVAAMGSSVYVASSVDSLGFGYSSGTSFSCPLTSGAIALLLSAYPELTPSQVYEAITSTASQAANPDNLLGYGIIDIEAAYYALDSSYLEWKKKTLLPGFIYLEQNYPNPFNPKTTIAYFLDNKADVTITIYDLNGRQVQRFAQGLRTGTIRQTFTFNSNNLASGVYVYEIAALDFTTGIVHRKAGKMILLK